MPASRSRPARPHERASRSRPARPAGAAARRITARALLRGLRALQEARGVGDAVLLGALCEVLAAHQPSARQALCRVRELLARAGVR